MKAEEKRTSAVENQLQEKDRIIAEMKQKMDKLDLVKPKAGKAKKEEGNPRDKMQPVACAGEGAADDEEDGGGWGINPIIAMARQMVNE